jgi:hypothetical protein
MGREADRGIRTRCDGETGQAGTGTTRRMSETSEPAKQIGTLFAAPIRASSRKQAASTGRTEDCTRPTRQSIKSALAMWEPSTEDFRSTSGRCQEPLFPTAWVRMVTEMLNHPSGGTASPTKTGSIATEVRYLFTMLISRNRLHVRGW